jgi:hypothetical protein
MQTAQPEAWKVWTRLNPRQPWRVVNSTPTKPEDARLMFGMIGDGHGDWLVSGHGTADSNTLPPYLRS